MRKRDRLNPSLAEERLLDQNQPNWISWPKSMLAVFLLTILNGESTHATICLSVYTRVTPVLSLFLWRGRQSIASFSLPLRSMEISFSSQSVPPVWKQEGWEIHWSELSNRPRLPIEGWLSGWLKSERSVSEGDSLSIPQQSVIPLLMLCPPMPSPFELVGTLGILLVDSTSSAFGWIVDFPVGWRFTHDNHSSMIGWERTLLTPGILLDEDLQIRKESPLGQDYCWNSEPSPGVPTQHFLRKKSDVYWIRSSVSMKTWILFYFSSSTHPNLS